MPACSSIFSGAFTWRTRNRRGTNFLQLEGEHGYDPNHPRRNAAITDDNARQQLIIDPGPRTVNHTSYADGALRSRQRTPTRLRFRRR